MEDADREQLREAALVINARAEVVSAVGELAASPLSEAAARRMQQALQRVSSPGIKRAIRALGQPADPESDEEVHRGPHLQVLQGAA